MSIPGPITKTGSAVTFLKRPSEERGGSDYGWLKTFHTFSFGEYVSFSLFDSPTFNMGLLLLVQRPLLNGGLAWLE